jgi:hypothetical protein
MLRLAIVSLLLLTACGEASGPKGIDPTALVHNTYSAPIYWYWFDGTATLGGDTIPAFTTRCEQFFAQPDSARFDIIRSDTLAQPSGWHRYTSNWFDPASRDWWTVDVGPGSDALLVRDVSIVPC